MEQARHLFLRRDSDAPAPVPAAAPAGFSVVTWSQQGPFDSPPGIPWRWRLLVWWYLLRARRPLEATVIRHDPSGEAAHVQYVFPRYFRFPFMENSDLQVGALWTEPHFRGRGLAKTALSHTLSRIARDGATLWYVVRPDNAPSIAVGRDSLFGGSIEGERTAPFGLSMLGAFQVSSEADFARNRSLLGSEFVEVSETARTPVTREAAEMVYTRYSWLADLARGRDALEVACGSAQGGMMIAESAKSYVAGDISSELLAKASPEVRRAVPLIRFDASRLPFADASFDLVAVLEAVYYLPDAGEVFAEIRRVLRPAGRMVVVSANPSRVGFVRSPHSVRYFTPPELSAAVEASGFAGSRFWGAFPVSMSNRNRLMSAMFETVRAVADRLGLIPRTLQGRAKIKALLTRRMIRLPEHLSVGFARSQAPVATATEADWSRYKVFYFVAERGEA